MNLETSSVPDDYLLDETPDIDYPVDTSDPEAPFGRTPTGRIRKKPVGEKKSAGTVSTSRSRDARAATAVLMQVNGLAIIGAMSVGMVATATELKDRHSTLEEQIFNALSLDPGLCAMILKTGVKSGKFMLLIALVSHGIAVAPTAFVEYRERVA